MQKPSEEKFRKIKLGNAAFNTRVGSISGGIDFLKLVGFELDPSAAVLDLTTEKLSGEILQIAGSELNNAMTNPYFGML